MSRTDQKLIDFGPDPLFCPVCTACGAKTRLIGLEPDPIIARTDLLSYQCLACNGIETRLVQRPEMNGKS